MINHIENQEVIQNSIQLIQHKPLKCCPQRGIEKKTHLSQPSTQTTQRSLWRFQPFQVECSQGDELSYSQEATEVNEDAAGIIITRRRVAKIDHTKARKPNQDEEETTWELVRMEF